MHPYLRLHVAARPVAPGPTELVAHRLRRVFGKALVDIHCPFGAPHCQDKPPGAPRASAEARCHVAGSCPYGVLFARSRTQRVPYALYVPRAGDRAGDRDRDRGGAIELSLFRAAWRLYAPALDALRRALGEGLGRDRRRFRVEGVWAVGADEQRRRIAGENFDGLPSVLAPEHFDLEANETTPAEVLEVELLSPTRLVRDGRLLPRGETVAFELIIARILDRFRELYGPSIASREAELVAAAREVPLLDDATRWIEVKDYSARMGRELRLGGLTGRVRYGAGAANFLPILRAGEILHVGKNPASGCGRIRVSTAD